jgi:hypothetical protein
MQHTWLGLIRWRGRWNSAPTANKCDVKAMPHAKCLQDPLILETTAADSPLIYSLMCDDDCQYLCDSVSSLLCPSCLLLVFTAYQRLHDLFCGV